MARGRVGGARTPSACDVLLTLALHAGNVILLAAAAALQEALDKTVIEWYSVDERTKRFGPLCGEFVLLIRMQRARRQRRQTAAVAVVEFEVGRRSGRYM